MKTIQIKIENQEIIKEITRLKLENTIEDIFIDFFEENKNFQNGNIAIPGIYVKDFNIQNGNVIVAEISINGIFSYDGNDRDATQSEIEKSKEAFKNSKIIKNENNELKIKLEKSLYFQF